MNKTFLVASIINLLLLIAIIIIIGILIIIIINVVIIVILILFTFLLFLLLLILKWGSGHPRSGKLMMVMARMRKFVVKQSVSNRVGVEREVENGRLW